MVEKSNTTYLSRLTFAHQNNAVNGIIIISKSRANEPSQPRNCRKFVAFMCASGGACCSRANQNPFLWRRQRLPANVCSGKSYSEQMFQRPNSVSLSKLYGPTSPRSILRSAWACPNATRSRSCAANGGLRQRRCTCSTVKCLIKYRANAQTICGPIAGTDPISWAAEGMKRCASRLAAGRTAVARGPASVAAARTNTPEASGTAVPTAPSGLACSHPHGDRRTLRSGSAWSLVERAHVEPAGEAEHSSRLVFFSQRGPA